MRGYGPSSLGAEMRSTIKSQDGAASTRIDFKRTNPLLVRRLFSSRVLKDLANSRLPPELSTVLASLQCDGQLSNSLTLAELYNLAFRYCLRHQRVEYFYKNAVIEKLVLGRRSMASTAAYVEMRIAEAKLDVLLAGRHLSAYEIKTDFDELARLPSQLRAYQRACRQVSVLTGERYAASVERLIPAEVGLSVLTDRYQIRVLRPAATHDLALCRSDMLALLRRRELLMFLGESGYDVASIPNTKVFQEALSTSSRMNPVAISAYVATKLLARSHHKRSLVQGLPMSLAASALAQDLTCAQVARLIELFEMDVTGEILHELSPVLSR